MEKNDLFALLKITKEYLLQIKVIDKNIVKKINESEEKVNEVFQKGNVINDQPIKKRIGNWYVEPLRYKNRLQLLNIYDILRVKKAKLEGSIRLNNF